MLSAAGNCWISWAYRPSEKHYAGELYSAATPLRKKGGLAIAPGKNRIDKIFQDLPGLAKDPELSSGQARVRSKSIMRFC